MAKHRVPLDTIRNDHPIEIRLADTMKERPILFSAPMMRALLDGHKSQTRRALKPQPDPALPARGIGRGIDVAASARTLADATTPAAPGAALRCPYGAPGDRLRVREAWRSRGDGGRHDGLPPRLLPPGRVWYEADGPAPADQHVGKRRPAIFMPRWASRLVLEVVAVRIERLQQIGVADCWAEGIAASPGIEPVRAYRDLWNAINGADAWAADPWVWVVEFRPLTA